jgi:putative flavoprotein involved in K+ transport
MQLLHLSVRRGVHGFRDGRRLRVLRRPLRLQAHLQLRVRVMSRRVERYEVIVVGAGQAGLAAGHHLARQGHDFIVIDGAPRIGESWRRRWDSLRLFTPAKYSSLPGLPFPAAPDHLPWKDEVAHYFERYVEHFDLPIRLGTRATRLSRDGEQYVIETDRGRLEASQVIIATGAFQRPRVPAFASELDPAITQLHSSAYRNPTQLGTGDVLVVGAANSGAQIAIELAATGRRVLLSGRDTGRIPRRFLGRDIYDWIWPLLNRSIDSRVGRRMAAHGTLTGDPLVGIPRESLRGPGLERVGRTVGARDGRPELDDGRVLDVASVIWCTGFDPDFHWIDLPAVDASGRLRHRHGVVQDAPGLYVLGLRYMWRLNSSLLGGVGADAERIVGGLSTRASDLAA